MLNHDRISWGSRGSSMVLLKLAIPYLSMRCRRQTPDQLNSYHGVSHPYGECIILPQGPPSTPMKFVPALNFVSLYLPIRLQLELEVWIPRQNSYPYWRVYLSDGKWKFSEKEIINHQSPDTTNILFKCQVTPNKKEVKNHNNRNCIGLQIEDRWMRNLRKMYLRQSNSRWLPWLGRQWHWMDSI
jgi:hypothetical protein